MRLRDMALFISAFALVMLAGLYLLDRPQTFQKEYIFEATETAKYGLVILDIPARDLKMFLIPEGSIKIKIESITQGGIKEILLDNEFSMNNNLHFTFNEPIYLKIMVHLDPGERISLNVLVEGIRNDLKQIGAIMLIIGVSAYLILLLISTMYRSDWI